MTDISSFSSIFIDVRNARAYVSRKRGVVVQGNREGNRVWTHESCANWQSLEALAAQEIERQGGAITFSGLYPCPDWIAALALWPEDVLTLVTTPQEAEADLDLGSGTVRKAAEDDRVPSRRSGATWLIYRPAAQDRWGRDQ